MNSIDFWNLAGRAGRLTKDLSGNIFCCRIFDKKGYWKESIEINLLRNKRIENKEPAIMRKNDQNLYKNIQNFLENKPFTTKKLREGKDFEKRKTIESYGNILTYHNSVKSESLLLNTFLDKVEDGRETLKSMTNNIKVPEKILAQSTNIDIKVQNEIYTSNDLEQLPTNTDYRSCRDLLEILYHRYQWNKNESGGRKPLIKKGNKEELNYYAVLMYHWINSRPLNYIIKKTIEYYHGDGLSKKIPIYYNNYVYFEKNNPQHLNIVINNLMSDIENVIRFKIKTYVNNYVLLIEQRNFSIQNNWSDYLEYGTTDKLIIELQNLGFPRHLATYLMNHHKENFSFNNDGEIFGFNTEKLREEISQSEFKQALEELEEIFFKEQNFDKN